MVSSSNQKQRKKYVVANWKMNFTVNESSLFLNKLSENIKVSRGVEVILAPALFTLQSLSLQVNRRQFKLAAQNFYWRDFGAFTGEVSIAQLRGMVDYSLVGHSERRVIFGEQEKDIRQKVAAALRSGITPILCIGESSFERQNGETKDVIYDQLISGLSEVTSEDLSNVMIAYEPVWAISTNAGAVPCTPSDAKAAVKMIRKNIEHLYGKKKASEVRVLFGGSVNSDNVGGYLKIDEYDGFLVGGASIKLETFAPVVEKANEYVKSMK